MLWLILIAILIVFIVAITNTMSWGIPNIIFYPSRVMRWSPPYPHVNVLLDTGYNKVKVIADVIEGTDNVKASLSNFRPDHNYINAWHFNEFAKETDTHKKTVLFCHGTSGNISYRSYIIKMCQHLGLNLLVFDYRGYGVSGGIPSRHNIKRDGEIAYLYLTKYLGLNPDSIVVWGESLGGHVATWIASKYECSCLVLMCTFSSISDIMAYKYNNPALGSFLDATIAKFQDTLVSWKLIRNVTAPVLLLHSKTDSVVPYQCADKLFDNIQHTNKQLLWIKGDHSSPIISVRKLSKLLKFVNVAKCLNRTKHICQIQDMLDDIRVMVDDCVSD